MFIADGDTIRVRLAGRLRNVRITGINAMELSRYVKYPSRRRGACHGREATALVERAITRSRWKVRLAAQKLSSRAEKDAQNLDGEWVDIRNGGGRDLRLGGWWVRDSYLRFGRDRVPGYRIPDGTVVPAGATLRLRVGCGAGGALVQHWCLKESAFENVGSGFGTIGDGAYLFDPQGDLRASQIYPCLAACSDPLAGKVRLDVQPRRDESISVANTSGGPVDLGGHLVKLHNAGKPDQFVFGHLFRPGTVLQPGETLRIDRGGSPDDDSRLVRHLGRGPFVLADGKGVVNLRTTDDLVTSCADWGDASCR